MIDDTLQTLRDLLAAFPAVRQIESERLALDLDRNTERMPEIREEMDRITAATAQSEAATGGTVGALRQNDQAIEEALDPRVQTSLLGDKLLVLRNFLGAVVGGLRFAMTELIALGNKSWEAVKEELPKGIGATARVAPLVALVTLAGLIAGPAAGIASAVPAFKPIANSLKRLTSNKKTATAPEAKKAR